MLEMNVNNLVRYDLVINFGGPFAYDLLSFLVRERPDIFFGGLAIRKHLGYDILEDTFHNQGVGI
jgi:hypothetical protein